MPKVSIILPIYNVEPYLRECLDSVVNQTLHEIEILAVNDGSTDGSLAILEEYARKDERIIIINKENGGQSDARNFGLNATTGEYILFIDPDDFVELDLCTKAVQKANETSAEVVIFQYDRYQNNTFLAEFFDWSSVSEMTPLRQMMLFVDPSVSVCKMLWRRSFLMEHRLTFVKGLFFEDIPFSYHAAVLCKKLALLPEVLYHYRFRPRSTTGSTNRYVDFSIEAMCDTEAKLRSCHLTDDAWAYFQRAKLEFWAHSYRVIPKNQRHAYRQKVLNVSTPEDVAFLRANRNMLKPYSFQCLMSIYGSTSERWIAKLKLKKYELADWLVRKLIPHSDWLQDILHKNMNLESRINQLNASMRESKVSGESG